MEAGLKNKTIASLLWKTLERFGAKMIQFVVSIVLARILLPEDFGVVALLTVFIEIATVFVQNGFSAALIQQKEIDNTDYNTAFWSSLFISIVVYAVIFIIAPYVANYYEIPILNPLLRVLGTMIVVGSFNSVQISYLRRNLEFKKLFICSMGATVLSGAVGIAMAYLDFGVWALIAQQLGSVVLTTISMIFVVKWKVKFEFSTKKMKKMFNFGWKLLLSGLLDAVYNNLYTIIIGKKYTKDDLAYFNKAKQFPSVIVENINGALIAVMFPVMSRMQDDIARLKEATRSTLKLSCYIVFPMMVGLAVCAEPIISIVLTDKWLPAVPFLQMWAVVFAFFPLASINLQVYNALGKSSVFLWLEIAKKIIGVTVLFVTLKYGLIWMMVGKIAVTVLSSVINAFPNKKYLKYGYLQQLLDLTPTILLSAAMGAGVWAFSLIPMNIYAKLVLEILLGVAIYVGLSYIFKIESFRIILNTIKAKLVKKQTSENETAVEKAEDNNIENDATDNSNQAAVGENNETD
ncbi:MAG: lipopolysaccharide biosynthesis protein [Clostridia bacterium]|nr:lipopolysaccharide biosynthesis protein [Clostridia bacterium]